MWALRRSRRRVCSSLQHANVREAQQHSQRSAVRPFGWRIAALSASEQGPQVTQRHALAGRVRRRAASVPCTCRTPAQLAPARAGCRCAGRDCAEASRAVRAERAVRRRKRKRQAAQHDLAVTDGARSHQFAAAAASVAHQRHGKRLCVGVAHAADLPTRRARRPGESRAHIYGSDVSSSQLCRTVRQHLCCYGAVTERAPTHLADVLSTTIGTLARCRDADQCRGGWRRRRDGQWHAARAASRCAFNHDARCSSCSRAAHGVAAGVQHVPVWIPLPAVRGVSAAALLRRSGGGNALACRLAAARGGFQRLARAHERAQTSGRRPANKGAQPPRGASGALISAGVVPRDRQIGRRAGKVLPLAAAASLASATAQADMTVSATASARTRAAPVVDS